MNHARPLLISADTELIDECARLAVAAGAELQVSAQTLVDRSRWAQASVVLVDIPSAADAAALPRRGGVIVVTRGSSDAVDPNAWRLAVAIGAEHVACLPDAQQWLVERLSESADEPTRQGRLIAVMSATGGAGASTLAASCVVHAVGPGLSSALIDGDRLGGGLDIVLGGEEAIGIRWPELVDTRGRLATAAFQQALPTMGGAAVLSWDREGSPDATVDSWNAVLDAALRGFDLTVVDLPRDFCASTVSVLSRTDSAVLVVSARVRGAIAASRCLEELTALTTDIRVIVRERSGGVRPEAIGQILGLPILGAIPVGAPFIDDGQLPRIPEAVVRACLEPGSRTPTSRAA
jgi:secretion/DNA translocation related CpaE-like protein